MDPNGDMLRLARHRRGFHQTEAASRLGVTQSLLSRYENKLNRPSDEFLSVAGRVYDVPASFFHQTDPVFGAPVSVHAMTRRKADVSARELDAVVAELNVRAMHLRKFVDAVDVGSGPPLPRLDVDEYGDPEAIAGMLRAHWGVPRGPLPNLVTLSERAGVVVVHSAMAGVEVSGVTFAPPGLPPMVLLKADHPADRLRYTLAHEIGHLVMHRFPSARMEAEANDFASALLMPANDIRPYFLGRRIDLPLLAALKPEWKVSMQSLLMRARALGMLERNQEEYLWKQMGVRRMRLREPPELDFPREEPSVMPGLFRMFADTLGYSADEMAGVMHLHATDVLGLYGGGEVGPPPRRRPRLSLVG